MTEQANFRPEPPRPQLEAARTAPRVFAWFVDLLVFFALWVLVDRLANSIASARVIWPPLAVLAYVMGIAVPLTALRGQTFGQMLFGIRVVDAKSQRPPGVLRSAAHVVLSLVPIDLVFFAVLVVVMRIVSRTESEAGAAALEKMPRRLLHDRVAGTLIVNSSQPLNGVEWVNWANRRYRNSQIAAAATQAAEASLRSGATVSEASVSAHKTAVILGSEYRCSPDRLYLLMAISVQVAVMLLGAAILGLFVNPQPQIALAAVLVLLAPLPAIAAWLVRRNSGFYLTTNIVSRRNWFGHTVATFPRSEVLSTNLIAADGDSFWGAAWADFNVEHPERYPLRGLKEWYSPEATLRPGESSALSARLYWWSDARFHEFQQVLSESALEPNAARHLTSPGGRGFVGAAAAEKSADP